MLLALGPLFVASFFTVIIFMWHTSWYYDMMIILLFAVGFSCPLMVYFIRFSLVMSWCLWKNLLSPPDARNFLKENIHKSRCFFAYLFVESDVCIFYFRDCLFY